MAKPYTWQEILPWLGVEEDPVQMVGEGSHNEEGMTHQRL